MAVLQKQLPILLCLAERLGKFDYSVSIKRCYLSAALSPSPGQFHCFHGLWRSPSSNTLRPFYGYLQNVHISTSRKLLSDFKEEASTRSPLTPLLTSSGEKYDASVRKQQKVQAVLKCIKQSPKKVNLVAALVRGMRVEDALLQLQVTIKRAAKTVYKVIHSARANAAHNHGLDANRLIVAEAFVGKGLYKKRISYHAKGRSGVMVRPECRLTVVLREITAEEEAHIARLRVHNFRKLTKRERQLVPHKLIETTPIWSRKGSDSTVHHHNQSDV